MTQNVNLWAGVAGDSENAKSSSRHDPCLGRCWFFQHSEFGGLSHRHNCKNWPRRRPNPWIPLNPIFSKHAQYEFELLRYPLYEDK